VDVQFEEATMPPIYQALRVTSEGFTVPTPISVILEVQQHLGEGRVAPWPWKPPTAWCAA
jgi:F-type H+-transporting ATPase subunit beta